jgi:hypothetical protein
LSGRGSRWTSNNFFVGNAGTGTAECRERRRGQRRERRYRQQQHRHRHGDGVGERFELDEQRTLTVGSTGHGKLNIESGGTVSTGTSGILSIASASGSAGTVNIGAPAGSAALAPGILSTNSVQFGAGTGTLNFNYTSDGYVFSPAISGSGTINVLAGMTLFHANDGGFTGTTNISGGALQIGDASHASAVLGDAANLTGGLLSGFGTVHGAVANSGGIVAPGDGVTAAILSIGSNYTQGAAGTLSILLTPSTASRLAVTGVASVDGTLLLSGSFARGQSYTILTAAGVSGAFSSVSDPTLGNTTFKVTYGSDDIAIMAPSFLASVGVSANQRSVGQALDRAADAASANSGFSALVNAINNLPTAAQQQAVLGEVSGQIGPYFSVGGSSSTRAAMGAAQSRLGGGPGAESFTLMSDIGDATEIKVADASNRYWGRTQARWAITLRGSHSPRAKHRGDHARSGSS